MGMKPFRETPPDRASNQLRRTRISQDLSEVMSEYMGEPSEWSADEWALHFAIVDWIMIKDDPRMTYIKDRK